MTANPGSIRTAGGVRLWLPESWLEVDPRLPDLTTEVVRTLTEHGAAHDETELTRTVAPLVFELRRLSARAEVLLVGLYTDFVDDDSGHVQVFTANVTVALSPPVGKRAGVREVIQREALADGVETGLHLLSGGPAFTTWGRMSFPRAGTKAFTRRFHVPVPGLDQVAVLAFSTPNVDFAAEFDLMFMTIADSFRFVG